jgi:hypothetical protein
MITISSIAIMADSMQIIVKSDVPFAQLPLTAGVEGEEFEFPLGWRMFKPTAMSEVPGTLVEIAQTVAKATKAPSICAYSGASGYLGLVFCEKGKGTDLVITGVERAKEAKLVDAKYKHHPLVAIGVSSSWSKKAKLKHDYDALKAAANREPGAGEGGEDLLLTWLVGLGIPGCHDVDPYWNEVGGVLTAQRKAFWTPSFEIDINL